MRFCLGLSYVVNKFGLQMIVGENVLCIPYISASGTVRS